MTPFRSNAEIVAAEAPIAVAISAKDHLKTPY